MASDYGGNGDSACDIYDRLLWKDEVVDLANFGGESPTYPGMREHVCPLIAANITPHGSELNKCLKCGVQKSGFCNGFNGDAPCPMRGARIIFR